MQRGVWREPAEESHDLYPGLCIHDNRVSGSITVGRSRLPLWALIADAICDGWEQVEAGYSPSDYGFGARDLAMFLHDLLQMRGEFGRLLLVLADAVRAEDEAGWWECEDRRRVVADQLRRCLDALASH
jgi:hypothetical protein